MADRLVTIATFDQAAQARLAQNALAAAGIRAAVSDESLVAMDWLLSTAVGGVKVQVREEDADRAVAALEHEFGADGAGLRPGEVASGELAAEAEAAGEPPGEDEAGDEPASVRESAVVASPDEPTDLPPAPGSREDFARRMVFTAILGLAFAPVAVYAVYLFLNAAFGEGELSPRGRLNLFVGGFMTAAGMAWFAIFFWMFVNS